MNIVVHIILGLPGETRQEMLATVDAVADLPVDGVKIHSLYIEEGMPLAAWYRRGQLQLLDQDTYVALAADCLERLPPHMTIHRLIGEGDRRKLLGPAWSLRKAEVQAAVNDTLIQRASSQGAVWAMRRGSIPVGLAENLPV